MILNVEWFSPERSVGESFSHLSLHGLKILPVPHYRTKIVERQPFARDKIMPASKSLFKFRSVGKDSDLQYHR